MPRPLRKAYLQSLADANQTSCADEVAICDARIDELLTILTEATDDGFSWTAVARIAEKLIQEADEPSKLLRNAEELQKMVKAGRKKSEVWHELQSMLELRRKIAESESKRIVQMNQVIPATAAVEVLGQLCQAFRRNVLAYAERPVANTILSKASRELSRIIAAGGMGVLMSGGRPVVAGSGEQDPENIDDLLA